MVNYESVIFAWLLDLFVFIILPEHSSPVHFHYNRAQLKHKDSFER